MNGPVLFLAKGKNLHPRLRGNNLVIRYGFPEGYCVITKEAAYMDDETWVKAVKVLYPGIRKTKVSNVALCFYYFILYLFNSPYLSLQILCRRFMISQI